MRTFLLVCCLASIAAAQEHWLQFRTDAFEIFTDAGARAGRETAMRFEQFRFALGQTLGVTDLHSNPPIRILLFKAAKETVEYTPPVPLQQGRDRWYIVLASGNPFSSDILKACAKLLIDSSVERMPAAFERGLIQLFSTLDVNGTHITLGRPVSQPERDKDWARLHLLATQPEFYGKLRVLFYNLRKGVDEEPAYRNAFGKSPAEIEKEVDRYFAAGNFATISLSGRPLAEKDFPEKPLRPAAVRLALADVLLPQSRTAYEAMIREQTNVAEAHEGLGLLEMRDHRPEAARQHFTAAIQSGAKTPRAYLEYARLEPIDAKAIAALEQAAKLDPKSAEAQYLIGQRVSDPGKRIEHLKLAASLDPRRSDYWEMLAETCVAQGNFAEAAKAYHSAEQAATSDDQRAAMREARLSLEQRRLDYEAAEKKRIADERERELEKLKQAAVAQLRALEARVNAAQGPAPVDQKPVPWWDGPQPSGKVQGLLRQVDCLGKQFRLVVDSDAGTQTRLLVPDPSQVVITGGGERTLSCGKQKSLHVTIEYFPKSDEKLGTVGEVATIQYRTVDSEPRP